MVSVTLLVGGCGSSGNVAQRPFDGFWQAGTLTLATAATADAPAWTIQPGGDHVALVMFRSDDASRDTADNEELVVQMTSAELAAAGAVTLDSPGRVVRFQRGAQKLTYASTTVRGSLTARREGKNVRGQVTLTASAPVVNVSGGSGEVTRDLTFDLEPK